MQVLTVVNQCLSTMGEVPLNSLEEPHVYRGAAQKNLETESRRIQAAGWWFNLEDISLPVRVSDNRVLLPGDTLSVRHETRNVVQRGSFLYDLEKGSYEFSSTVSAQLIRLVDFPDLPESAASYIAASAVLRFQSRYDGDTQRRRELESAMTEARIEARSEHIRSRRSNFIASNVRLQRLKHTINQVSRTAR